MNWTSNAATLALVVSAIGLAACERPGATDGPVSGASEVEIVIPDDVSVPSAEEAAAEAARAITSENADAAFEELARDIEADDEDGG